ncbi:MAG TPA: ABC transporter substrate-binding protein, partial [Pilimelia sp.]|nr:ABC transporter substrate-binding protein [Pilimelia sp.]
RRPGTAGRPGEENAVANLPRGGAALAGALAVTLTLGACGGPDGAEGAAITIYGIEPQNPLVPGDTPEVGGGKIVNVLWSGLVDYPPGGGAPRNLLAESIESPDARVYTIRIRPDTTFHDGSPVTANSFVEAWNWVAYGPHGAANSAFLSEIAGYGAVHPQDPDGVGPRKAPLPAVRTMSGLKVVDRHTFTVTLAAPSAIWPTKLGHMAFSPMPPSFFTSTPDEWGRKPVGNGPVRLVSWTPESEIRLTRYADYALRDRSAVADVTVKIYQQDTTAYADLLAGNLDFMEQVPVSTLAGGAWERDLGDRRITIDLPATHMISFPLYDPRFADPRLRRAVSYAIDRRMIVDKLFSGLRKPADSFSNPTARGYVAGECTACRFDLARAQGEFKRAGGFTGEMIFYYNADSSHKEWVEAVVGQVRENLGVAARAEAVPTFAALRTMVGNRAMKGPHRAGWRADYPDVEIWLGPLYTTGGAGNDGGYRNPKVDALYAAGVRSTDLATAHARFAEAGKLVDADLPAVPVFYASQQSGYSPQIEHASVTAVGELDLATVRLR